MIGLARFPESASNWIGISFPILLLLISGYGLFSRKVRALGTVRYSITLMSFIVSSLSCLYILAALILDAEDIIGPDYSRTRFLIIQLFFLANLAATIWVISLPTVHRWYFIPAFGSVAALWLYLWMVSAVV